MGGELARHAWCVCARQAQRLQKSQVGGLQSEKFHRAAVSTAQKYPRGSCETHSWQRYILQGSFWTNAATQERSAR